MIKQFLLIVLTATWIFQCCSSADARKPNIVLIMADDFGYECATPNGGQSYNTPNLDGLAAGGMRFERCYVQPLCTPTRVQLMTGQYNVRNYIEFRTIDPDATTFAHLLKNAGYATGIAGKWQLGTDKYLPQRLGFDEAYLWQHTRRPPRYANPGLEFNGEERDFTNGEYGPDIINDFAIDFVTRHKDEPFLLYYPMILTHAPYPPTPDSPDWNPKAKRESDGDDPKHFADMVAYMDKLVGQLIAKLDELSIRDNTLVIFLGDNGTGRGLVSQFRGHPYPGGKGSTTARGMHVPLLANWPGRVPDGKVNDDLIDSTDFFPTVCDIASVPVPATLTIDGRSFAPQLIGETGKPREWIYSWYGKDGGPKPSSEFAMNKTLKLYRDGTAFDLHQDPFEDEPYHMSDLSDDDAAKFKPLQAVLDQYIGARPAHLRVSPGGNTKTGLTQRRAARQRGN